MNRRIQWSRLRRLDKWLVAVLMPVWAVAMVLHVQLAASDSLRTPAIVMASPASNDGFPVVTEVLDGSEVIVSRAGLALGDELMSIGGIDVRGRSGFHSSVLAFSRLGDVEEVPIVARRGEQVFAAQYPFGQFPIPWWWPTLFAASFGIIGLLILLSAPTSATAQAVFPGFVTFALTWLFFPGNSELQVTSAVVLYAISMVFAGPLVVRAILLLPDRTAIRSKMVYAAIWAFALMSLFGMSAFVGVPFSANFGQKAHLVSISLFYLVILAVLARNYYCADKLGRRQLRWVMLGFYLAFVPAMLVSATIIMFPQQFNLYTLSSIGMPIIPLMFLIAIARYNLFDIDRMIGGTISYSILVVLIAVLAESVIEPLVADTGTQYGLDGNTVQILFVAILTAVLIPAQRKWRPFIDRVFFAEGVAIEEAIETLIDKLEDHDDDEPDAWIRIAGQELADVYKFEGWSAFRLRPDGMYRALTDGTAPPDPEDDSLWQRYARRIRPGTEQLGDRDNYLVVPIRPRGQLEWLLVLGPKSSGDVYTTTDNGLIASVAHILAGEIADHTATV